MRAAGFDDADEIGRGGFGIVYRCTQVDLDRLSWSVGWSYDLCTPAEQQLWRQLSVFAGSFELEAVEDICDGDLAPDELLDLLSALVDKSILTRTEHNGVVRFRMLETLRDYGHEQIRQTDQYAELRRRHADWYRRLLRDAAADWFTALASPASRMRTGWPQARHAALLPLSCLPSLCLFDFGLDAPPPACA